MFKKLILISVCFLAKDLHAESFSCSPKLMDIWIGPVATEILKRDPNSPAFIKEIVETYGLNDKGASFDKLVATYRCNVVLVPDGMGFISFERPDVELYLHAKGGSKSMNRDDKVCFTASTSVKATKQLEVTKATFLVDYTKVPVPIPVAQCP